MKRVKVMLTIVALLAVVGGTLAFKAAKDVTICIYTKTTTGQTALLTKTAIRNPQTVTATTVPFATTLAPVNNTCPSTALVTVRIQYEGEE